MNSHLEYTNIGEGKLSPLGDRKIMSGSLLIWF